MSDEELAVMQAVLSELEKLDPGGRRRVLAWAASRLGVNARPALTHWSGAPVLLPKRGPSDEQLLEALALYRSTPHAPTEAVAKHYGIAHRTASLWIKRAQALESP